MMINIVIGRWQAEWDYVELKQQIGFGHYKVASLARLLYLKLVSRGDPDMMEFGDSVVFESHAAAYCNDIQG